MSESSRLAALPGYDTAPDVYETLDSTDDTSTTFQDSQTSPSEASNTSEDEEDEESYGVSRRRLFPERARSRFGATSKRVETKHVDLSDRVDGRRRGYKVRRKAVGGGDEEDEGLEARIARLRREIEECRAEAEEEREAEGSAQEEGGDAEDGIDGLSRLLASIEVPSRHDTRRGQAQQRPQGAANGILIPPADPDGNMTDEQMLSRVTDFDSRLAALEQVLGVSALDPASSEAVSTPVLPSLLMLDQQLGALTSATSLTNLEAASSRVQKLKVDAEQLNHLQHGGTSGGTANGDINHTDGEAPSLTHDDMQKLHSLYALLPNLQALSPTVPAIVARLRSLRTLHTGAANAASELEEVERRQAEMDKELAAWREGLEAVETAVSEADAANGRNGRVVEGWVKELEGRMMALR
ncbi:hypothetical protein LTR08_006552 [Meristemomyces frigidus]|nr:hypothetical protein LTR08_006552 [Meristemomyces frigidus]